MMAADLLMRGFTFNILSSGWAIKIRSFYKFSCIFILLNPTVRSSRIVWTEEIQDNVY